MKIKIHVPDFERNKGFYPSQRGIDRMLAEHPEEGIRKVVIEPIFLDGNFIGYQLRYHFNSGFQYPCLYHTTTAI